ncbi:3-deoxy-manno-octulosonate cytidylyltransferase [Lysinibacillus sphaericus]|nr:3-deoxy-manno-octulosonate cytidylyltransferase [Lysinibacillus sphaericus]
MKIVAIIQARMTSTRLPGKVLKKVLGKTLLEYQLERVRRSQCIDEIVVATTVNKTDDPIVELCSQLGYSIYRGSEEDVLSRYYEASIKAEADIVVRLTSDCPLVDPEIIDQVIELFKENQPKFAYVSNTLERTYPRGMDTEVFSIDALHRTYEEANRNMEREHVTAYMYSNPEKFSLLNKKSIVDLSQFRWTVDTEEDFELIRRIIEKIYPNKKEFTLQNIVNLVQEHQEWSLLNAHIEQKKL